MLSGLLLVGAMVVLVGYIFGNLNYQAWTDDAYVDGHVATVIPKVPAYVLILHIDDNTLVKKGDLLVELDPRDFEAAVAVAKGNLAAARGKLAEATQQVAVNDLNIRQSQAELKLADANSELAESNLKRVNGVSDVRAVSTERDDEARAAAEGSRASVLSAQVKVDSARAQVALAKAQALTAHAIVEQADAQLQQATLNLSYSRIYATDAGTVTNKTVEEGNYVQPGQALFSIVPDSLYVIANYKETQLTHVKVGQKAEVSVDTDPDLHFTGYVESIQRGTGSRFALLPPENATGNFVKVVQRVPVKIVLDNPGDAMKNIAPGMSVEVRIQAN